MTGLWRPPGVDLLRPDWDNPSPLLHVLADWPLLIERLAQPVTAPAWAASGKPTPAQKRQALVWINALGPFKTPRDLRLRSKIEAAVIANSSNRGTGGRVFVASAGLTQSGKSTGAGLTCLGIAKREWETHGFEVQPGTIRIPVIYLEASRTMERRGIVHAIAEFIGAPASGTALDTLSMLRRVLPKLRTLVVVIDDAHQFTTANLESRLYVEWLKTLITGLPVTVVVLATHLEGTAWETVVTQSKASRGKAKNPSTADVAKLQVKGARRSYMSYGPYTAAEWRPLLGSVGEHLAALPPFDQNGFLRTARSLDQAREDCQGRFGLAVAGLRNLAGDVLDGHGTWDNESFALIVNGLDVEDAASG